MFLTLFFIVVFFSKKDKRIITNQNSNNTFEIFEVDNILNYSQNPALFDDYWGEVCKEMMYVLILFLGLLLCIYFDNYYIMSIFFSD
jgi:hypothetical protein